MRVRNISSPMIVMALACVSVVTPLPLLAQTAAPKTAAPAKAAPGAPAPGTATGSLSVAGKSVSLTHAVAFNAGARIYLVLTDQVLPPDEAKSEFELAVYQFKHHVSGLEFTLDPAHKVTEMAYRWELAKTPCPGCFDVSLSGGPDGPLAGTVKTTAKGEAEKLKVDVAFSAPFARPSAAKR